MSGTDPNDRNSYLKIDLIEVAGEVRIAFRAAANITSTVQSREPTVAAEWHKLADVVATAENQIVRLTWTIRLSELVLEQSAFIGPGAAWQSVGAPLLSQGGEFWGDVTSGESQRFYRLRLGEPTLTTIATTSPLDAETDVAVSRETIVNFSAPLAEGTELTPNEFYDTLGEHRILSRVEVASNRRKATLFYLEPLP